MFESLVLYLHSMQRMYILTHDFYMISESNHILFQFFCSKLKITVFMCQTWQLAVHIQTMQLNDLGQRSMPRAYRQGKTEVSGNIMALVHNIPQAAAHPHLHVLPYTISYCAMCRILPVEVGTVRGQSYSVRIMPIQRQQKKKEYPAEIQFYLPTACLNTFASMAFSCLQGLSSL